MTFKKICVMALCVFLLTVAFSGVGKSQPEMQNVYNMPYGGLVIDISAPIQAYPGDNINITVKTEAEPEIYVEYLYVKIFVVNPTTEVSLRNITHLLNSTVNSHQVNYNLTIPSDISPALTYGEISCEWEFMGAELKIPSSGFVMTYIKDVAFEELQAEYETLNATHQELNSTFTEMETKLQGEAGSNRNLAYIFIATTIIAAITVGVLLMRKPKRVWV